MTSLIVLREKIPDAVNYRMFLFIRNDDLDSVSVSVIIVPCLYDKYLRHLLYNV